MAAKILIIEDEAVIRRELRILLENAMYETAALTTFHDILPQIREQSPVLLARIGAVLKRTCYSGLKEKTQFVCKGVRLDIAGCTLTFGDEKAELTKAEMKILYQLFRHSGEYISRMDLIEYLWENKIFIDDNTLGVHMTRIREKLKAIVLCVWLAVTYLGRKRYFEETGQILDKADKRYLLGELLPPSFRLEDRLYRDIIIRKTSLQEIVEDVLEKNRLLLIRNGVRAEVDCPDPVYTDGKWVAFIVNQMILNSVKYCSEQPVFLIRTKREQDGVSDGGGQRCGDTR